MKNTETDFHSFEQFEYLQLQLKYFFFFSNYLKDIAFKYLKNQNFFWKFQVTFHMYLDMGQDNDDDYDHGKSSDKDYYE